MADTYMTYAVDVIVATERETLDAFPHCSEFCASGTLANLDLPDTPGEYLDDAYAYMMPFSEHETMFTYVTCHACGVQF